MTPQAQNALLKTLEEPPEYAVILILTMNVDAELYFGHLLVGSVDCMIVL